MFLVIKDLVLTDKVLIQQLLKQVDQLTARVKELESVKVENERLRKRVSELEQKLSKYENPKNSGNSSVAPSQDPASLNNAVQCLDGPNFFICVCALGYTGTRCGTGKNV